MAHELFINESGDASMMYVGQLPWHGLGQSLDAPPTAEEAIQAARLDWEVVKTPLFYHLELGKVGVVPGHYALVPGKGWVNPGERPVFGVVSDQYQVLQNRDAFAFFDPIVEDGLATYETAGALGKGERVWVLAKMRDEIILPGDDVVGKYLLLSNSHDGKSSVQVKFTPVRVVCNNTLTMALDTAEQVRVEHTPYMHERLENAQALMKHIAATYRSIEASFHAMLKTKLADENADAYFDTLFPDPAAAQPTTADAALRREALLKRARRDRAIVKELYLTGRHNTRPPMWKTLWAAYNSVTEYVDQYVNSRGVRERSPGYRLNSAWFGAGARTKVQAYETAIGMLPQMELPSFSSALH